MAFVFTACNKEDANSVNKDDILKSATNEKADLILRGDGDFERVITKPLVRIVDFYFMPGKNRHLLHYVRPLYYNQMITE